MIKKIKKKFIVVATLSMILLMSLLVGVMNVINYSSVVSETDRVIDMLWQMKDGSLGEEERDPKSKKPDEREEKHEGEKPKEGERDGDEEDHGPREMSPEVPYESRYFTVLVSETGEVKEADLTRIISVDEDSLSSFVKRAMMSKKERGFIQQFRYAKTSSEKGIKIIFLDCGRKLDSFRAFLWTSIGVGVGGCIVVFAVFFLSAGKIIRPIAESYEKQRRFITDAGHEIKTPLTIISANLDLLEAEGEDNECLEDIRTQTGRLSALTGDLVYLSKMEEMDGSVSMVDFPLSDLLSETAQQFQAVAQAKNKELQIRIQPDMTMYGAPSAMRQLITILLDNAMKYSPKEGSITLTAADRTAPLSKKRELQLMVTNTTFSQMSGENLQHLFDRFYRTDASRNSETGGHGIGLSMAQAITNAHNGKIAAELVNGSDFRIHVTMPLK